MVKFYENLWLLKKITNYWHLNFLLLIAPKRGWHLCYVFHSSVHTTDTNSTSCSIINWGGSSTIHAGLCWFTGDWASHTIAAQTHPRRFTNYTAIRSAFLQIPCLTWQSWQGSFSLFSFRQTVLASGSRVACTRHQRRLLPVGNNTIVKEERCYLPDGTIMLLRDIWTKDATKEE